MSETKVYTVAPPDEDELFEKQMAALDAVATKPPAEDPLIKKELDRKQAFEKLMFLSGEHVKEFEFGGLTFRFKANKSSENAKILHLLQVMDDIDTYKASILGLASSLLSVNDIPFEEFYTGDDSIKDPLLRKYTQLFKWPAFMVTELMRMSTEVQAEVQKEFSRDFLAR